VALSQTQLDSLSGPLSRASVKTRKQSGRTLSYVEGWHVIAEANRIFGFDGWTRETLFMQCVSDNQREIGESKTPGFGVTYISKVRIAIGDVVREGFGSGHGIDRDHGLAHESAIKEAETDAMKRAFMTFGNPFGLALYDKEQASVVDEIELARQRYVESCKVMIDSIEERERLHTWWGRREAGAPRLRAVADRHRHTERSSSLKNSRN
jgi:DNA repair and recombination protein RAD52